MRKLIIVLAVVISALTIAGCDDMEPSASEKEQDTQNRSNETLVNDQPAEVMDYSPTRDAAIQWANTWEKEGKIAYIYFSNMMGEQTGYFILKGLPVSYDASLTPTQKVVDRYEGDVVLNNPAIDGMYYGQGADTRYYGYDAVSGSYLEWSANGGQEFFISDQPLNAPEAKPLGDATVDKVKDQQGSK